MRKLRQSLGFTMAELLIVVAIIGVLSGVSFIAVQNHQRSTALLERDSIAKEIFIAAQNHMTMAESQGYMGVNMTDGTIVGQSVDNSKVYYAVYNGTSNDVLNVLLPFGSIDETVRAGGRYVISYQTNPARILDVFYWTPSGRFGGTVEEYTSILDLGSDGKRNDRMSHNPIIGWFGGEGVVDAGLFNIDPPEIEVVNAEKLYVKVKNKYVGTDVSVKLIITSRNKHGDKYANASFVIATASDSRVINQDGGNDFEVILDDITTLRKIDDTNNEGMHFADLNGKSNDQYFSMEDKFIPGEDITVQAVAFSNSKWSNIAYSAEITTNSLFADVENMAWGSEQKPTALIGNIRHLENLDDNISSLDSTFIAHAKQTVDLAAPEAEGAPDLSWSGFKTAVGGTAETAVKIYDNSNSTGSKDNTFMPVSPSYGLTYDGNGHSIEGIAVDCNGNAGLFGELKADSSISNLELIDFNVKATQTGSDSPNAGALAGSIIGTTVTNVVARNSGDAGDAALKTVTAVDSENNPAGSVGGLIGSMTNDIVDGVTKNSSVNKCAAALIVSGNDAGGLIGKAANGGAVTASYSGGHTIDSDINDAVIYSATDYNVTASSSAGGLIGDAGTAAISNSYSTCSAKGATAGGLVGSSEGEISNSYATGLVDGTTYAGAFAGMYKSGTLTGNHYFEIVNELPDTGDGYTYLKPVGKYLDSTGEVDDDIDLKDMVDAFDETAAAYNEFTFDSSVENYAWQDAAPYNATLKTYYGGKYPLKTVEQLGTSLKTGDDDTTVYYVATHHGDWPAPEIFVINK